MSRPAPVLAASLILAACGSTSPVAPSEPPAPAYARMPADPARLKPGDTRTFAITYVAHVADVPAGAKRLRVWLPVPQDSPVQTITGLAFTGGAPTFGTEKKYGNKIACFDVADPKPTMDVTMTFTCARTEQITDIDKLAQDGVETDPAAATFLAPDRLTIVDDRIRAMAADITADKTTTLEKSKAIYDYVLGHMTYDKSGQGWGRGDTNYACDAGKGNCTDFHALFISLARASGIAAGFEIGLFLPYERGKQEKPGGYHCWSFFRVPGEAWVPVDISEASKNPDRAQYFFGAHTANRVTLSVGRDLVLDPPQAGAPLNYLLDPYAEADGKPVKTSKDWTYKDLP
jgi:transglutaminase-like putative cysteine protease